MQRLLGVITLGLLAACASLPNAEGQSAAAADLSRATGCSQKLADGTTPPASTSFISPRTAILPFYQWQSHSGYCGEVSMIQAGLNHGQWTSQYNARLLCGAEGSGLDAPRGTALSQTGPAGFCSAHAQQPDYNAQLLLEPTAPANVNTCLANYGLSFEQYDSASQPAGKAGYRHFIAWVKAQLIAGREITLGVLEPGGTDEQYDHIVSVVKIGTNHDPSDATYFGDDVLYIEDHGSMTFLNGKATNNPAIPPQASSTKACIPYVFGYTFDDLGKSAAEGHADDAHAYSILIPGQRAKVMTGGNGVANGPSVVAHDFATAVIGPVGEVLPVTLDINGTATNGKANPRDRVAGFAYESPFVGDADGEGCSNAPPASWMDITFGVTVSGLQAGTSYVLYEYDFDAVTGIGSAAALAVPTSAFNANAGQATHATPFVAEGPTFTTAVTRSSGTTVVFRAVPADAP